MLAFLGSEVVLVGLLPFVLLLLVVSTIVASLSAMLVLLFLLFLWRLLLVLEQVTEDLAVNV